MKIYPQPITSTNFAPFGRIFDLREGADHIYVYQTATFTDRMLELEPFGDSKVHLGMTLGSPTPCPVKAMEIHPTSEEAILCLQDPIVLCVAPWDGCPQPEAQNVQAFLLRCGQVAVMNRNVWHDACHGIANSTHYYWLARACPDGLGWVQVKGNVVVEPGLFEDLTEGGASNEDL